MKRAALTALLLVAGWACAAFAVPVDFVNASRATQCAEEDNVYVKVLGPRISHFRIRAEHPAYINTVTRDSTAPDFTACDMSQDPSFPFSPRKLILYEDDRIRLVGHSFPTFWRPEVVDFRVGARNEPGLHLVQLLKRGAKRDIEILVVYPSDGYWRLKPLPPPALEDSAYGSSFLFGPVEEDGRPYVAIRSIAFEPATLTFRLVYRNGARGVLRVAAATRTRTELALTLDPPVAAGRPFAALRSMFVTPAQADVAVVASAAGRAPILEFKGIKASAVRFGRMEPSQHNLSAPDLVFERFAPSVPR